MFTPHVILAVLAQEQRSRAAFEESPAFRCRLIRSFDGSVDRRGSRVCSMTHEGSTAELWS
jgi:hypothetical protein